MLLGTRDRGSTVVKVLCYKSERRWFYPPGEWNLRPTFHHWPPPEQAAIIWIVAHLVAYRLQTQLRLSLDDYMDLLKRARWKEYHRATKTPAVGRYLDVL
jgi:hypothetical protein